MKGALVLLLLAGGCAPTRQRSAAVPTAAPPDPNASVAVYEVVEKPEDEAAAFLKVYVDGELAGQTATGPKSQEKSWNGRLAPGNRLFKLEYWTLAGLSDWKRLEDDFQPRERFIRLEEGAKTKILIKFFDQGRKNAVTTAREAR